MLFHHSSLSVCKDDISLSCRQGMKSCQLPVNSFILETTARWMHISYRSDSHFMLRDYMFSDSGVSIIQLGYSSKGPCKTQNDEHFSDIFFTFNSKFFKIFFFYRCNNKLSPLDLTDKYRQRFCVGPCWLLEQYITAATILFSGSWTM